MPEHRAGSVPGHRAEVGSLAVGLDVGGTKLLGVLVDLADDDSPEVLEHIEVPVATTAPGDPDDLGFQVAQVVQRLVAAGGAGPLPVGIGVAGYVDLQGVVVRSPNVPQAVGVDLAEAVRSRCGLDPVVDNDANCVAVAALAWGRPGVKNLVAVTLGTGIGGAVVVDRRLVRGANGFAGEPGHMVVVRDGLECVCGQRGCWERYASGSALGELAQRAFSSGRVGRGGSGPSGGRGEALIEFARRGDASAREVLAQFATEVALGLSNLVNLLDPELIVLGGGVSRAVDLLIEDIVGALASNPTVAGRIPPIEVAPFAESAGALGAAREAVRLRQPGLPN